MKVKLSYLIKDLVGASKSVNNCWTYIETSKQAQDIAGCTPCERKILWDNYNQTRSLRALIKFSVYLKLFTDGVNTLPSIWDPQIEGEILPLKQDEYETTLTNSIPNMLKETKIPLIKMGTRAYLKQSYEDPENLIACQRAMKKAMISKINSENRKNFKFLLLSCGGVSLSLLGYLFKRLFKK